MKKKTVLQFGAVLLSVGFVMAGMNGKTDRLAQAEDLLISENEDFIYTESEEQDIGEEAGSEEAEEIIEESESQKELDETEILLEGETEIPAEEETESVSEMESESETETESESESEEAELVSVKLNLDQDLETVPTAFSEYLNDLDVYTVTLIYEDGSEQAYDQTDERYQLSVDYEDSDTDGMIRRTYHATISEDSTGKIFEDTQYVDFGKRDPIEIKTEEMTSVILEGKKKWIMVQSTPEITGRYAMNSNKMIENIYYASDDGEIISAEDAFRLQQGMTYKFLIKLK